MTLHDKGLKYSTLNTAKSAISAVIFQLVVLVENSVNTSGQAVRGLVKSRVEFPPAQIR